MPSLHIFIIEGLRAIRPLLLLFGVLLSAVAAPVLAQDGPAPLQLHIDEPRAFGHQVGDIVTRTIDIDVPTRLKLDESSLPAPGRIGNTLELRSMQRHTEPAKGGQRLRLRLAYQVFVSPPVVRSYDLPAFTLRFQGTPRPEELRIESWPVVVAPLLPPEGLVRTGLGELRPDEQPRLRDTHRERWLLAGCAVVATGLAAYLALVYVGLPWLAGSRRPFGRTYRQLRQAGVGVGVGDGAAPQDWQRACRALHAAFNETAGRAVFADTLDAFFTVAPRFAPLAADIRGFFARSQAGFFAADAAGAAGAADRDWLLGFARACRNAERGSA